MNADIISRAITSQIERNSGLDQHRNYLGISKIAECPRKAYFEFLNGSGELTESAHRMCYAGYHHEADVLELLKRDGIALPAVNGMEVVSPLDSRLRGHIDGLTVDNELIEIKSLNAEKFRRVSEDGRPLYKHFVQVQLYMRYGQWNSAFVIYRNRETYEHLVLHVPYQPNAASKFERKAASILEAIDNGEVPACECGHCPDRDKGTVLTFELKE